MNCLHGRRSAAVITKKCSDHKIFITKIFIYGIFSSFTKILNHRNLELYDTESKGIPQKLKVRGLQHSFHVILTDKLRRGEVRMLLFDAA